MNSIESDEDDREPTEEGSTSSSGTIENEPLTAPPVRRQDHRPRRLGGSFMPERIGPEAADPSLLPDALTALSYQGLEVSYEESYIGPLLHPDLAARWDKLVPGTAREIMDEWLRDRSFLREESRLRRESLEAETKAAREMHKQALATDIELANATIRVSDAAIRSQERAPWFTIAALVLVLLVAIILGSMGLEGAAIAALSAAAFGVVTWFLKAAFFNRNASATKVEKVDTNGRKSEGETPTPKQLTTPDKQK